MSARGCAWALRRAVDRGDHLASAHLRIALAAGRGTGVRLSWEEVTALTTRDNAVAEAAANILESELERAECEEREG